MTDTNFILSLTVIVVLVSVLLYVFGFSHGSTSTQVNQQNAELCFQKQGIYYHGADKKDEKCVILLPEA